MALHRDIFWVGKQWAVTGYGMQAVDQKQKSRFDIEASRLWEDDLFDVLSDQRWFNAEDFNAGLTVARAKFPEAPAQAAARKKAKESARFLVAPSQVVATAEPPRTDPAKPDAAPAASKLAITSGPSKATIKVDAKARRKGRPAAQVSMRIHGWPAKFTQMWRIRINRP